MRFSTPTLRAAAATTTACAMALTLTACGSDKETTGGGLSTAATAPGATIAEAQDQNTETVEETAASAEPSKETSANKSTSAKPSETKKPNSKQGGDAAIPSIVNPFEEGFEVATYEPIAGGRDATADEKREMEQVVKTVANPPSVAAWTRIILDNSCAEIREPAMEEFERQGLTLTMVEQLLEQQAQQGGDIEVPKSDVSLADVRVEGDRASATVTVSNSGGTASNVQLFAKEDGKWKVCTG